MTTFHSITVVIYIIWLIHTISCVETETTDAMADVMRSDSVCFGTVTHYHTNPKVTGESTLIYSYKNDDFKINTLTLSCEIYGEDLFIEVESVSLLLPAGGTDDQYCVESKTTSFDGCKETSQCACCEIPQKTCESAEKIETYAANCNRKKNCTIEVTSNFLRQCTGRMYDCEGKKCHSRWAMVTYKCLTKDAIPTPWSPSHEGM